MPPKQPVRVEPLNNVSRRITRWLGVSFPDQFPFVFVTGCPKSGTSWVAQLVSDYLRLPFPRHSPFPIGIPAVIHGHDIVLRKFRRCVYVMRDGRDVMCSLYFHLSRQVPEGDRPAMSRRHSQIFPGLVNRENVRENMPAFVEAQMKRPYSTPYNWGAHVRTFMDSRREGVVGVRYEDLLADAAAGLASVAEGLTGEEADPDRVRWAVEKFSFEKLSGRRRGQESRSDFLRKGEAGDWVNHFNREAAEIFDLHCGKTLIEAGYEADRAWIERCPPT